MKTLPFDENYVKLAPAAGGVYIIYEMDTPVYVGRSIRSIRARLYSHRGSRGNWFLKLIHVSPSVSFEFLENISPEQVEALLIKRPGTGKWANYRLETDPAFAHLKQPRPK